MFLLLPLPLLPLPLLLQNALAATTLPDPSTNTTTNNTTTHLLTPPPTTPNFSLGPKIPFLPSQPPFPLLQMLSLTCDGLFTFAPFPYTAAAPSATRSSGSLRIRLDANPDLPPSQFQVRHAMWAFWLAAVRQLDQRDYRPGIFVLDVVRGGGGGGGDGGGGGGARRIVTVGTIAYSNDAPTGTTASSSDGGNGTVAGEEEGGGRIGPLVGSSASAAGGGGGGVDVTRRTTRGESRRRRRRRRGRGGVMHGIGGGRERWRREEEEDDWSDATTTIRNTTTTTNTTMISFPGFNTTITTPGGGGGAAANLNNPYFNIAITGTSPRRISLTAVFTTVFETMVTRASLPDRESLPHDWIYSSESTGYAFGIKPPPPPPPPPGGVVVVGDDESPPYEAMMGGMANLPRALQSGRYNSEVTFDVLEGETGRRVLQGFLVIDDLGGVSEV